MERIKLVVAKTVRELERKSNEVFGLLEREGIKRVYTTKVIESDSGFVMLIAYEPYVDRVVNHVGEAVV